MVIGLALHNAVHAKYVTGEITLTGDDRYAGSVADAMASGYLHISSSLATYTDGSIYIPLWDGNNTLAFRRTL